MAKISQEEKKYPYIPLYILQDPFVSESAKLFFSRICALSKVKGYCFASNEYFAKKHRVSVRCIQKWLSQLKKRRYVKTSYTKLGDNKTERKIYVTLNHVEFMKEFRNNLDYEFIEAEHSEAKKSMKKQHLSSQKSNKKHFKKVLNFPRENEQNNNNNIQDEHEHSFPRENEQCEQENYSDLKDHPFRDNGKIHLNDLKFTQVAKRYYINTSIDIKTEYIKKQQQIKLESTSARARIRTYACVESAGTDETNDAPSAHAAAFSSKKDSETKSFVCPLCKCKKKPRKQNRKKKEKKNVERKNEKKQKKNMHTSHETKASFTKPVVKKTKLSSQFFKPIEDLDNKMKILEPVNLLDKEKELICTRFKSPEIEKVVKAYLPRAPKIINPMGWILAALMGRFELPSNPEDIIQKNRNFAKIVEKQAVVPKGVSFSVLNSTVEFAYASTAEYINYTDHNFEKNFRNLLVKWNIKKDSRYNQNEKPFSENQRKSI